MSSGSDNLLPLAQRASGGDGTAWQALVEQCHDRLRKMVALRLDPRLQGRVDPSDVLQEVYLNASVRLNGYLAEPKLPFYLWLRCLASDRLVKLHRFHLGTQARDAAREVALGRAHALEISSTAFAVALIGRERPPGEAAEWAEQVAFLQDALARLDPLDRDILALRHFEQLTSAESGQLLGISSAAAAKRYFRALERLRSLLTQFPGGLEGFLP